MGFRFPHYNVRARRLTMEDLQYASSDRIENASGVRGTAYHLVDRHGKRVSPDSDAFSRLHQQCEKTGGRLRCLTAQYRYAPEIVYATLFVPDDAGIDVIW